jgi:O-antigen biosynthesis protein
MPQTSLGDGVAPAVIPVRAAGFDRARGPWSEAVCAEGQSLYVGRTPFQVRGVTYGSFLGRADGSPFPETARIDHDFGLMERAGVNCVRLYAPPPADLVELAADHGLRLIVGPYYDDWRMEEQTSRRATQRVLARAERALDEVLEVCAGSGVLLAVSVGNEVPADVVRLHGIGRVSTALSGLVARVHEAQPDLLVTYTSFPTTEFLQVEGQDLLTFNVFLEDQLAFRRYLRRLQVQAMDRPIVLTEVGAPSVAHGEDGQRDLVAWQLREVQRAGLAGAAVFSWTDEWGVDGEQVGGWGFGLTDEERRPKPALDAVTVAYRRDVSDTLSEWPSLSVIVCAYNEERHIGNCLASLRHSTYPGLEVIVCDDGSSDRTAEIVRDFDVTLLELPRGGLSAARNAGWQHASGELVAYLDADAMATPDWPFHLALGFEDAEVVALGGPNLPVPGAADTEAAVARCPGNPQEVLVSDDRAEHVPGCNMAFRRRALEGVGGFDAGYTAAGDDVDVCWKLLDLGHEIGFAPAAVVHHHRRDTLRRFLRQQRGYGRAERMLSGPHRHRINRLGSARWSGVVYGPVGLPSWLLRSTVYHGWSGAAPFQPVVRRQGAEWAALALAFLPLALLVGLLGALLVPLSSWFALLPVAVLVLGGAAFATIFTVSSPPRGVRHRLRYRFVVAAGHLMGPLARQWGRLAARPLNRPQPSPAAWSGDRQQWAGAVEQEVLARRSHCRLASPLVPHDLVVTRGLLLQARVYLAVTWGWRPHARVSYRPRLPLVLAALGVVALGFLAPVVVTAGSAAVLLLLVAVEFQGLRRTIYGALAGTTRARDARWANRRRGHGRLLSGGRRGLRLRPLPGRSGTAGLRRVVSRGHRGVAVSPAPADTGR